MPRFKIDYREQETGEWLTKIVKHQDYIKNGEVQITAREWAEDEAYTLADKGPYVITEMR